MSNPKPTYSGIDTAVAETISGSETAEAMDAINDYHAGRDNDLSVGQQMAADEASNAIDASFIGPISKK